MPDETVDAYCQPSDLLTGNIPTPAYLSPAKYCVDAADEIDSKIGFIYETRVDISLGSPVAKPVCLLLKRLNVFLASGRLLMAAAAAQEDTQVHAYALSLIRDAEQTLAMIASGELPLTGATPIPGSAMPVNGPKISNGDVESMVDAFYNRTVNPYYWNPSEVEPYPATFTPGKFVR